MPTVGTAFGRRVPLVDLHKGSPIPPCFVFQLTHELTPTDITDGCSEVMVLHHVLDRETLDADHLVLVNNARREFMLIVPSPISNLGMDASHFETGLVAVLRPLLLLGKPRLGFCQLLFILAETVRSADALP